MSSSEDSDSDVSEGSTPAPAPAPKSVTAMPRTAPGSKAAAATAPAPAPAPAAAAPAASAAGAKSANATPRNQAAGASVSKEDIDDHAIPLVTLNDETGKFEVNEPAVQYLNTLDGRVAVVAIAGLFRTGKSYLLNLLMERPTAFAVGPTVKACTKGIWLWGRAVQVEGQSMRVVFLDTEGLGSTTRSETYDCRIFALALLLSSYFIYNSTGTIDGAAINKLSLVVNLTKHIHTRQTVGEEDEGTDFEKFFPKFMWVVRDFTVRLERNGRKISARDYLEEALMPEEGATDATIAKNNIRTLLRNFFPERDCMTLVRPIADDEKKLTNLAEVPFDELRPQFQTQIELLRKRLYSTVRPKTLYGKPLSGAMLAALTRTYVNALNMNQTPTISSAWERVVESQCEMAVSEATRLYNDRLQQTVAALAAKGGAVLSDSEDEDDDSDDSDSDHKAAAKKPKVKVASIVLEEDQLWQIHRECKRAAKELFLQKAVKDDERVDPFKAALKKAITTTFTAFSAKNAAASEQLCSKLLADLVEDEKAGLERTTDADHKAEDATALKPVSAKTAMEEYRRAANRITSQYSKRAKGPAKFPVLVAGMSASVSGLVLESAEHLQLAFEGQVDALKAHINEQERSNAKLRGELKSATTTLEQERLANHEAMRRASDEAQSKHTALKELLDAKEAEVQRATRLNESAIAANKEQHLRTMKLLENAEEERKAAQEKVDEAQAEVQAALQESLRQAEIATEARKAQAEVERELAEMRENMSSDSRTEALNRAKTASMEREIQDLREHIALLNQWKEVNEGLMRTRDEQKAEMEYQWADAKGKLAEAEGEKLELLEERHLLTQVAAHLKLIVSKAGKTKSVVLDPRQRHVFDSLPHPEGMPL